MFSCSNRTSPGSFPVRPQPFALSLPQRAEVDALGLESTDHTTPLQVPRLPLNFGRHLWQSGAAGVLRPDFPHSRGLFRDSRERLEQSGGYPTRGLFSLTARPTPPLPHTTPGEQERLFIAIAWMPKATVQVCRRLKTTCPSHFPPPHFLSSPASTHTHVPLRTRAHTRAARTSAHTDTQTLARTHTHMGIHMHSCTHALTRAPLRTGRAHIHRHTHPRTHGRTDARTDARADGRTDARTHGHANAARTHAHPHGITHARTRTHPPTPAPPSTHTQAALCGYPLYLINAVSADDGWKNKDEQEQYEKWGQGECQHQALCGDGNSLNGDVAKTRGPKLNASSMRASSPLLTQSPGF